MNPPLQGIRIVEFEGLGPGPLAGRMLADMGAEVTVIARLQRTAVADQLGGSKASPLRRGKNIVPLDLKQPDDLAEAMRLVDAAAGLIEGNRPGVMERLGLGPADCAARNPALVYGRMTGWGQTGPLAQTAGHDLNYVALTGMLALSARPGQMPMIPPTVLGDAGGALGLAFGMVCAMLDARATGRGRVVDGAIVDTVAMLGSIALWVRNNGQLDATDPSPFHQSPFYDVYACADGGHITIGALEPQFYALLVTKLGLEDIDPARQYDRDTWPALKARFTALFLSQPRAHWDSLLGGTDVCYAPVLTIAEAARHPHNAARGLFVEHEDGTLDTVGAPRFLAPDV
ncbi:MULTISPECIES: CaiB/BaiF CoA-transferase family protein [unclassified Cupriavidus]|uniref:CaiB/BaiF CoA transferase family protein n=1 Tax=unclassified Cupriavidus TaxID=2640874 RepID=UPI001C00616D|nr:MULTISPECIES: CaiB/BaiF CoA-transferase family protein [unclassified Cupriavidus]MCA3186640.1 CoA transferase [Cupriavidus sp.]MCA3192803.1 CoA transferase [Cupriavidus sp.]MCA3195004.1 CoA transferase [Cupriavidus sp.]MCA3203974.1 CoA transferase [Cupriavidus sp.]MCA3205733.1 CoA transferase [Cupriavidus sp.]